jgi:multiple sugar transport system substrate-binding protein
MMGEIKPKGLSTPTIAVIVIVALIIGIVVGYFIKPIPEEIVKTETITKTETAGSAVTITKTVTVTGMTPTVTVTPTTKVKITWLHTGWGGDTALKIVNEFMKENPDIEVEYVTIKAEEYHSKLAAALATGECPYDIVWLGSSPPGYLYEYADRGWLMPIENYIPKEILDDLLKPAYDTVMYKGHLYGLPWYFRVGYVIMFNEDMLKAAGIKEPAKTWNEVVQQCLTIKEKGVCDTPFSMSLMEDVDTWETFQSLLVAFGGKFYDDEGNCLYNSDLAVEVLQWMLDAIYKHKMVHPACLELEARGILDLLCAGEVAYQFNLNYYMSRANDPNASVVAGKVNTALLPGREKADGGSLSFAPPWGITSTCKHPEAAARFLAFLGGPKGHRLWAIEKGLAPAYKSLIEDPEVLKAPAMKGLDIWTKQPNIFALSKNYCGPEMKFFAEFEEIAKTELSKAITGIKSPKETLDAIVEAYNKLKGK